MSESIKLFLPAREAKYFCNYDWTTQISLKWFSKLNFTRTRSLRIQGRASNASGRKRSPDLPGRAILRRHARPRPDLIRQSIETTRRAKAGCFQSATIRRMDGASDTHQFQLTK
jgi:hypothetical protein